MSKASDSDRLGDVCRLRVGAAISKSGAATSVCRAAVTAAATAVLILAQSARAVDYSWTDGAGGVFQDPGNWAGGAAGTFPDDNLDRAIFNLADAGYVVTLNAGVTNSAARVLNDTLSIDLDGHTYTLSGTGSTTIASLVLGPLVGNNATLTLRDGNVNGVHASVAASSASIGSLTVGSGAALNLTGTLTAGQNGQGTLTVSSGGDITAGTLSVGNGSGAIGTATITGSGSTVAVPGGSFIVGTVGTGTLNIVSGGAASGGALSVATNPGSAGTLFVTGAGSSFTLTGSANIGSAGPGIVNISAGGAVSGTSATLGPAAAGSGTASLSGGGSAWNLSSTLTVGSHGPGSVAVQNGATLTNTAAMLGSNTSVTGEVAVSGSGSIWSNNGTVTVGLFGHGTVNVTNGADVTSQSVNIANMPGSTGSVVLSGPGTTWTAAGSVTVGGSGLSAGGSGTLTIEAGAAFAQTGGVSAFRVHGAGTVNLNGGTLTIVSLPTNTGAFNFNAGTLNITGGGGLQLASSGPLGGMLVLTAGKRVNVTDNLHLVGDALLVLEGGSLSAGSLTSIGEVQLSNETSVIGGGTFTNSGLLTGTGRITATFTNNASGQVRVASAGERLFFDALSNTNSGTINVFNGGVLDFDNTLQNDGQINFTGGVISAFTLVNSPSGRLAGRGTVATDSIQNSGQLSFSGGFSDIIGELVNGNAAKVIVTGGGTATFYGNITSLSGAEIRVSTGSSAVFLGHVTNNGTFSGSGEKYFEAGSTGVLGAVVTSGSTIVEAGAQVTAQHVREHSLAVHGHVQILANGTSGGTSRLAALDVTGQFDLTNNKLVIAGGDIGTSDGTTYGGLSGLIQFGRNGGTWTGSGIITSMPDAQSGLTTLGIKAAESAGTFGGVPVAAGDALIMYTYGGDANLDGFVSGDDYTAIDFAIAVPNADGWVNGDFNYDGFISGDDYTVIDFNIAAQGTPFSPSSGGELGIAMVAVPEPAGLFAAVATALLVRRRRRFGARRHVSSAIPASLRWRAAHAASPRW